MKASSEAVYTRRVRWRNRPGTHLVRRGRSDTRRPGIVGTIRLRDEALLLKDTLDHLAGFVDTIIVFDDASTDDSVAIALDHPAVHSVISNRTWRASNRIWEETANRRILLQHALKLSPEWIFYSDADERFEGDIREYLLETCPADVQAVRISLFDAYITPEDAAPFESGDRLWNFRKRFGPERRNIMMAWRANGDIDYRLPDSREPQGITGTVVTRFACQHYGKALSIEQWDETCRYYVKHFPALYRDKWAARIGKAVHTESDFGRPLYAWNDVAANAVDI
ncbi:glycosyltransferase family 2 protein [Plantibacter sp. Mn2098]|uniref:glycosyltransferase family 2 protein n=1 Tax=Plantibacter sp. Mn2098 TaxID=3395266 RepID=UPI003BE9CD41